MLRAWVLVVLVSMVSTGCGESRQALYMEGMKVEGDAERGPCKLIHDKEVGAALLTGDQVQQCLQMQSEALALYERAAGLGLKDADFVKAHDQARGRVARLEGMLKMVREMERPAGLQGFGADEAKK
jgi:cyanophycinase-like exopeptidase